MKTTTLHQRLAHIMHLCAPFQPSPDSLTELTELLDEARILVLPATIYWNFNSERKPNGHPDGLTEHSLLFTFMDTDDTSTVTMKAVGVCNDDSPRLSNRALAEARENALMSLFCRGLTVATSAPVSNKPPVASATASAEPERRGCGLPTDPDAQTVANRVNAALPPDVPGVKTANVVPTAEEMKRPTKLELADQMKQVQDWQNGVHNLDRDDAAPWNAHLQTLRDFAFMGGAEKLNLFKAMHKEAIEAGLAYNETAKQFYHPAYVTA